MEHFAPTTEFAEVLRKRTEVYIDKMKNITHSYSNYKEYYDQKAKAAPQTEKQFCFLCSPKQIILSDA